MAQIDLLVLGASGRVGQLLRRVWPEAGFGFALWQSRSRGAHPTGSGELTWDLGQPLPRARAVLVLSGITRGTDEALEANVTLAAELAKAIRASGAGGALFASTMAVYGRTRAGGAREEDAPDAPRPYGAAKLRAEEAFLAGLAGALPATVLRFGNVAGADLLGDVHASGRAVTLDRFGSGGPRRSYLGPRHLARVVTELSARMQEGAALPQHLNVAGQRPIDMADLLRAAGIPFAWQPAPEGAMEEAAMCCDRLAQYVSPRPSEEEEPLALARDWPVGGLA